MGKLTRQITNFAFGAVKNAVTDLAIRALGNLTETSTATYNRESVFDTGYIRTSRACGTSKGESTNDHEQAYFSVMTAGTNLQLDKALKAVFPSAYADFWEINIDTYSEEHAESFCGMKSVSESAALFTGGHEPVKVALTGKLMTTNKEDYMVRLLLKYFSDYNPNSLAFNKKRLRFVMQDTYMYLLLTGFSYSISADAEDYVTVSMAGEGFKYKNASSLESGNYKSYVTDSFAVMNKTISKNANYGGAGPTGSLDGSENVNVSGTVLTSGDVALESTGK